MEQLSAWMGAGIVTAGVSAALLAGAGAASADTGSGSESGGSTSSGSTSSDAGKPDSTKDKTDPASPKKDAESTDADTEKDKDKPDAKDDQKDVEKAPETTDPDGTTAVTPAKPDVPKKKSAATEPQEAEKPQMTEASQVTEKTEVAEVTEPAAPAVEAAVHTSIEPDAKRAAPQASSLAPALAPPAAPSLLGFVGSVIGAVVVNVGSVALSALQAVEALASGPPVLPPGSTVTVKDSWITLRTGQRVAANWYYPEVDEGDPPPDRMILLNHGFLALGPMYSYTAANLAQSTGSIVVTPSIPSNFFLGDDYWLGGTGMASAIADLFVGDRAALTQSALDAGYATQYGLDPTTAKLPQKFGLAGHSLGGNLVPGVAGFLATNGAASDLVGVITLDGVPLGTTLTDALAKLDAYDAATPGDQFIPIREIGAPANLFNSLSTLKQDLSSARPDRFTGVELTNGVHMDSMRGGNPLIQFSAYVAAGFPVPQNPPAVDALMAQWFNEWFAGDTGIGDDLVPGSTIDITTPQGTAHGVVIGAAAAHELLVPGPLEPSAPTTLPELNPTLAVAV
ncbi:MULTISPECIES: alpha/beta hydrolase [unclassified Mycobacterium]|uniref:alpha/beta hydrolase n=1 Tax=unclassified Mycobacterium TaxID=2642494 RepID=UPI0029C7B103|nr:MULTISPECIES: alpha/beta hydrolase [unclassified Mycobacterium]